MHATVTEMGTKGKSSRTLRGVIEVTRSGKGFLITPEGEDDVMVPGENLLGALSGDTVEVEVFKKGPRPIGRVAEVLERKRNSFVGLLVRRPDGLYLEPDDSRVYMDFLIVGGVGSPAGQKVIVDIVNWDAAPPHATIRRALGMAGAHDTEMRAILADHDFDTEFPADVVREAEAQFARYQAELAQPEGDGLGRRDFRNTLTFTIDPVDAKDFDDAISFRTLENGHTEVGVHIADVSFFVREEGALDREATARATSVYLVDRTIPMLPPQLSEELCSLKPNEDRLTFSFVVTLDGTRIVDRWFGRGIICSKKRFTYEEADVALTDPAAELHAELTTLNTFAQYLRKKRIEFGALIFDREELRPILNEKKVVVGFSRTHATPSHQLIEELMLLANREVATLVTKALGKKKHVFMYRVHDVPNIEKLESLAIFLRALGFHLTLTSRGADPQEINRMLESVRGSPEEGLIQAATIRSMSRAVYTTKNIGHYGLSFKDYAHFTSPIRRFPDLMVHRMLTKVLSGEVITDSPQAIEDLAVHSSTREAEAADAERDSIKLKQVEFMSTKLNTVRPGTISGVTEWGIYIADKESGAEGMVRLDAIPGDMFEFQPKKFAAIGMRSKKTLRLGDAVMFKATAVDLRERTIDLALSQA